MQIKENIKIVKKDIDILIDSEYNPRQLTHEQFKHISDSIKRFGFVDPILINKNKDRKNIIIGGHQRTKVAKDLGYKEIPCVELDLTLEKEKELNIRLNRNTGEWDFDELGNHFDISDLEDWGFNDYDLRLITDESFDIEQVDEFSESINFLIKCETVAELEEVQKRLGADESTRMSYEKFMKLLDKKLND